MRAAIALVAALIAAPGAATPVTPPVADTTVVVTQAAAALQQAQAAYATAAKAVAAVAPICTAMPKSDTYVGTAGTPALACTPPADATRATVIQSTTALTSADGTFSGVWPVPFTSAPIARLADIDVTSATAAPYKCSFFVGGVSATAFAGKCWQIVPTALPSTLTAVLGMVVNPLTNAGAGLTVRVTGRQ